MHSLLGRAHDDKNENNNDNSIEMGNDLEEMANKKGEQDLADASSVGPLGGTHS